MTLKALWERSKLRQWWHDCPFYNDYRRLRHYFRRNGLCIKYLMPNHLWVDSLEVVITTKCNLRCPNCSNLMQFYEKPYDVDKNIVIASMRKLNEGFDWCDHYKILGGEPFLNPNLKFFLEEVPRNKCGKASIYTNATIIQDDPELFEVMRRQRINIILSNYSSTQEAQRQTVALLEREHISYEFVRETATWTDYGPVVNREGSNKELDRQFRNCFIPCKSLLNGCLYYCPRSGHGYDLGLIDRKPSEYVDILHNTTAQNRRKMRRLMWRHKHIEACKYCQRGTNVAVKIPRGIV